MNIEKWIKTNCNTLKGKRVVITGATGGLGKEICQILASLEADITLACRNQTLADKLKTELISAYPNCNIEFVPLDFSNKQSVDKCLQELKKYNGIDILINNAGVYNVPIKVLDSGYNNIFQINFVYTYYFTKQLLPELEKKQGSTCITLGSIAHNYSTLDTDDIDFSTRKKPSKIYGNSKRFLMFSLYELFKESKVSLAIVHPGVTLTNMTNHYPKAINWLVKIGIKIFFPSPQKAVLNVIFGTSHNTPYMYWIGPAIFNIWGQPKIKKLKTCTQEESLQIYNISENIYQNINKKSKE
ncbi:MAG: SDR family NAD(P)-dependent oxidoreductase [Clostridia bacterium]|nr:SDR family NAD(P)-dependent oxidoreductase [Clostridia bacterium]